MPSSPSTLQRDKKAFFRLIAADFVPRLHERGFSETQKLEFLRIDKAVVQVLNFQPSQRRAGCYLNLGVNLSFLRDEQGKTVSIEDLDITACQFRYRVPAPAGYFPYRKRLRWELWLSDQQITRAVTFVARAFEHDGLPILDRFTQLDSCFDYNPMDITSGKVLSDLGMTDSGAAYALAQIHQYLGNKERARAFAEHGLGLARTVSSQREVRPLIERLEELVSGQLRR